MNPLYQWIIKDRKGWMSITDYFESEDEMIKMNPSFTEHFEIIARINITAITDPDLIRKAIERRNGTQGFHQRRL